MVMLACIKHINPCHRILMHIKAHKKMKTSGKYFIPIALVKILFVYLILQLFFSSCESEELFYDGDLYSDGALVEIPASFGEEGQGYTVGDTILLEIAIDSIAFVNELTHNIINLNNAAFTASFAFTNNVGKAVIPSQVLSYGFSEIQEVDSSYIANFGYTRNKSLVMNNVGGALPFLKLGFVFKEPGDYTVYFINTPNNFIDEGDVDIFYNYSSDNDSEADKAYAVYLFDVGDKTTDYDGINEVLDYAGYDQAIIDFKVVKE